MRRFSLVLVFPGTLWAAARAWIGVMVLLLAGRLRSVTLVLAVLFTLQASAQGALLRVDITYTNGQILSGPLTFVPEPSTVALAVLGSAVLVVAAAVRVYTAFFRHRTRGWA